MKTGLQITMIYFGEVFEVFWDVLGKVFRWSITSRLHNGTPRKPVTVALGTRTIPFFGCCGDQQINGAPARSKKKDPQIAAVRKQVDFLASCPRSRNFKAKLMVILTKYTNL